MFSALKPSSKNLRYWQVGLFVGVMLLWHLVSRNDQYAFFIGEPVKVAGRVWSWFMPYAIQANALFPEGLPGRADIYQHLGVTLLETVLAFFIGTILGLVFGLWLALAPTASAILDPYIKAANSMPRVILAPIFGMWLGLGIWSKVALAVTLVFFIVFFNVYQGVKEVSPVVLANARMLGANRKQLLRTVYLPSATSWVRCSHVGGAGLRGRGGWRISGVGTRCRLPDSPGRRHVRCEHGVRGHRGAHRVRAGARQHRGPHRKAPDEVAATPGRNGKALGKKTPGLFRAFVSGASLH